MSGKTVRVSSIRINQIDTDNSLVGFASCVFEDAIILHNISIHKEPYRILFPEKRNREGQSFRLFSTLNQDIKDQITDAIIDAYKKERGK